ncbi:cardiotrophin-2-like [Microcaecilia unicolor]|uniref:Cardiotrophin-2-like n=1 Tax=Microcaecilia unicolor TaxID=1415580 RepID=A0A6P7YMW4_9AMPH|nr:cardiotrophin-2-like [Microcaecilia unicolor]
MTPSASLRILCFVALYPYLHSVPIPATETIRQTHSLALLLQSNTSALLNTYLSYQGSPFSDPGFSSPYFKIEELPKAAITFRIWRGLSVEQRLAENYQAYTIYAEFFQLVLDDQRLLNPGQDALLGMLRKTKMGIEGLLNNLASIMGMAGYQIPMPPDPLMSASASISNFNRKVRGYVVCTEYRNWMERTVRDFTVLLDRYHE